MTLIIIQKWGTSFNYHIHLISSKNCRNDNITLMVIMNDVELNLDF